jgi:hypothetical protein
MRGKLGAEENVIETQAASTMADVGGRLGLCIAAAHRPAKERGMSTTDRSRRPKRKGRPKAASS